MLACVVNGRGVLNGRRVLNALKREREELSLHLNLAKLEARDEWEELEKKLTHLQSKLEDTGEQAKESLEDVGEAASIVAEEIKAGYHRIRARLKD